MTSAFCAKRGENYLNIDDRILLNNQEACDYLEIDKTKARELLLT